MKTKKSIELLAPAGDFEKLQTALHFGADAVYFAGKNYGLRAFSDNFELEQLKQAVDFVHSCNKKAYITVNIVAKNSDFCGLKEYLQFLENIGADAVIVSDFGIMEFIRNHAPSLKIHVSTQANITNKYSARFIAQFAERLVLARELNLSEISEIKQFVPDLMLEAFVHGAMCISYSGRCLISDYLTGRSSNKGECAQSCRWQYKLIEESRDNEPLTIQEDQRGSYILNSKDLNMIEYIDKLAAAGIESFKIEGRAKSPYYVGGVVNAYRRALMIMEKAMLKGKEYICPKELADDLYKVSHRKYYTGFYFGSPQQYYDSSRPKQTYEFIGIVLENREGGAIIEQRNRFFEGDELELVSIGPDHGKTLKVQGLSDLSGTKILTANIVQQRLFLPTNLRISPGDLLRKKTD